MLFFIGLIIVSIAIGSISGSVDYGFALFGMGLMFVSALNYLNGGEKLK